MNIWETNGNFNPSTMFDAMTVVGQLPYAQKVGEAKGRAAVNEAEMSAVMTDMVKSQFDAQIKAQKKEEPITDIERKSRLISMIKDPAKREDYQDKLDDEIVALLS